MASWSELEVELIIADYFQMLHAELNGLKYNKAEHRNNLMHILNGRSDSSIEFKHQNISAAMIKNGLPYISGYKPRWNFQQLLENKILQYLYANKKVETDFKKFVAQTIGLPSTDVKFEKWIDTPPERTLLKEPTTNYYKPVKRNYLELEQKNRSIGETGEQLVYDYEKWRLNNEGYPKLAKEVKWISKDEGDGAGFDILSKNVHGQDMFIEVKTTTLGKDTPIFFSKTENDFSNENKTAFHLYRVFEVKKQPKMFMHNGRFQDICSVEAINFKGIF